MKSKRSIFFVVSLASLLVSANGWSQTHPPFRPVPPGVVELIGFGSDGGIVELKDGTLMLAQGGGINEQSANKPQARFSKDGGKTWTKPQDLNSEIGVGGMIRLKSGALAIYGRKNAPDASKSIYYFSKSMDEGKTWTTPVMIRNYPDYHLMFHSMIQLSSGRLLLSGYWSTEETQLGIERIAETGWGYWRGRILFMEGHRGRDIGMCITYHSDDEGATWKQGPTESIHGIDGYFDEKGELSGAGVIIEMCEPTAAETKDGRVLLFARSRTGRLLQSYSQDGGMTWYPGLPTELSSSQSPPLLIRIPNSGDLLCVWNQVSAEEIRRGFLRGRLSAALSKDSGLTWQNFKTLELQEGMEDVDRITPEFPISMFLVGRSPFGTLPAGFAMFTYPNVDIVGEKMFLRYSRVWPHVIRGRSEAKRDSSVPLMWPQYEEREAEMTGDGGVMRIYPLEWFYK
jgi:hypothetical protein